MLNYLQKASLELFAWDATGLSSFGNSLIYDNNDRATERTPRIWQRINAKKSIWQQRNFGAVKFVQQLSAQIGVQLQLRRPQQ